jgi:hypothetical protein
MILVSSVHTDVIGTSSCGMQYNTILETVVFAVDRIPRTINLAHDVLLSLIPSGIVDKRNSGGWFVFRIDKAEALSHRCHQQIRWMRIHAKPIEDALSLCLYLFKRAFGFRGFTLFEGPELLIEVPEITVVEHDRNDIPFVRFVGFIEIDVEFVGIAAVPLNSLKLIPELIFVGCQRLFEKLMPVHRFFEQETPPLVGGEECDLFAFGELKYLSALCR